MAPPVFSRKVEIAPLGSILIVRLAVVYEKITLPSGSAMGQPVSPLNALMQAMTVNYRMVPGAVPVIGANAPPASLTPKISRPTWLLKVSSTVAAPTHNAVGAL